MTMPNFFIVGAAKSGTTSLWRYLSQHPQVFMPQTLMRKEPSFFSDLYGMRDRERYLALFNNVQASHQAIGEASTAYLTDPVSAARIADAVPEAKIIIMLRNPVDRAYSLYNWMAQEGYEYATTFRKALRLEEKRYNDPGFEKNNPQYFYNYLYFRSGLYCEQVRRYLNIFAPGQVHIMLFEQFIRRPQEAYRKVCAFLGITESFEPSIGIHNQSRVAYYPPLQYALRKLSRGINAVRGGQDRTKRERDVLLRIGLSRRRPPKLSKRVRERMQKQYTPDVQRLEQFLNEDLDVWKNE